MATTLGPKGHRVESMPPLAEYEVEGDSDDFDLEFSEDVV